MSAGVGDKPISVNYHPVSTAMQRQTAVTADFKSKQLLLFVFVLQITD